MIQVYFVVLKKFLFFSFQRISLYVTKAFPVCSSKFSNTPRADLNLWHCRFGHYNKRVVHKLSQLVERMKNTN